MKAVTQDNTHRYHSAVRKAAKNEPEFAYIIENDKPEPHLPHTQALRKNFPRSNKNSDIKEGTVNAEVLSQAALSLYSQGSKSAINRNRKLSSKVSLQNNLRRGLGGEQTPLPNYEKSNYIRTNNTHDRDEIRSVISQARSLISEGKI